MRRRASACALLVGAAASPAVAAGSTASAITLRPLSLLNLGDLDFGTNISGVTAGTIVIDPSTDGRSTTGGVVAAGGAPKAAKFYTYGGPLQTIQIFHGGLPTLTRVGGGTMNVTQFTLNGPVTRFLNAAGLLDLRVGGTLAVGANQTAGAYTGTFTIIVNYF